MALGHRPPPEEEEEDEEEEEPSFLRISAISPLSHCLSPPPHTPPLSRGEDRRIGKEMAELVPPCMAHKSICQNAKKLLQRFALKECNFFLPVIQPTSFFSHSASSVSK